ncbi:MAG: C25 family cysteine peptidase, partial [Candidatus Cloacimonetes bacterium]|nr:C25 family cysteine peptidase [Candidatus Cloacimonadota bacterium]
DYGFELQFKLQDYSLEEIQTKAGNFDQISIDGFGFSGRIGEPKLPVYSKLIAVPVGANVQFEFVTRNQQRISGTDTKLKNSIIPAQPSVSKSANPELIPFEQKIAVYNENAYSNSDIFHVEEIGFMRGVRIFRFDYEPIQYNPKTGDLQICNEAYIKVNFLNADMLATKNLLDRTGSAEYDAMYGKLLYNWSDNERVNNNRYPTKILILCPPNYTDEMATYVDWKKQQGYSVIVTTVGTGGTVANTTAAINTYMAGVWSAATVENPAPTYLLIVGDTSTTGDNVIANTGASGSHVTDLTYVRLQGTDYLPEMYYGRFSVSSATELTNIITKTLTFQKTLMPDLSYLGKVVMIAGVDAGAAPTYGNGQINYGTTHYFNSTNGITSNTYLYPASGSSDASIIANANEGRGYINYTAHGSTTSWGDPTFTVSDVNAMTNTNKYGVMVGNCCVTNAFNTGVCFGESIIRKANGGGVNYIGATNNSYWDEDYWWGIGYKTPIQATAHAYNASTLGAYDAMFHKNGEAFTNWATTVGEINVMGNTAVEQSNSGRKPYYWEIYSIMGDPTTMPYLGVPTVNTATFPTTILVGATSITVTATPYSRVALTMGGVTYGTALVPAGGSLTLAITPFSTVGTATLVITAQNKITRIESITIAPNSGAYMTVDANTYNDTNNSVAEYNETGRFTTTFKNVGSVASGTTTATLTCATAGITITDGTESIAALAAGASVVKTNAFSFTVANNIVNQLSAAFTITMVSGSNTWVHNFSQVFNAPALAFGSFTVSDPAPGNNNGRLDPGETVTLTMPLNNTGAATSPSGSATLTSPTSGITINTGTASYAAIAAGGSTNLSFSLTAASGMTVGTVASLVFNATAGAYTANKTEATAVGLILEDFETGNFNAFPWVSGGTLPWTVVNSGAYAGTYAAKSGLITHSQTSTLETTRVLTTGGNLTFWYKVSSETNYDFLKFYVDGVIQNGTGWSGEVAWTQATYALAAGTRVLKWEYMKDTSIDSGSNCAWIDNIVFPASTGPSVYNPPQNLAATSTHSSVTLNWNAPVSGSPTGYKIYKNSNLLTTVTALTYTDTAVTNGTTYSYYLKAVYADGESDPTATINATPNAVAPTNLIAAAGNALINLSWTAATGRGSEMESLFSSSLDRAISGYKIYRNGTALTTVTGTSYQNTGLTNGTSYSYYVTTVYTNPAGESAASNTVTATPTDVATTVAIIGAGTSVTGTTAASPINIFYKSRHGQSIYTAAELRAAGVIGPINITQLGFYVSGAPATAMPNFIVRMKPTTATNVATAETATGMVTVYSNTSYLPVAGGYQMLTLSTPFLWDGTSNLVIDTAFGLLAAYNQSGTVQYTTVTSGYMYWQSDTADQTNVFTSGTSSTSRPNVRFVFAPITSGPQIAVNPTSLAYGNVAVGTGSTQSFTITNTGGQALTGTITTPTGYTVALQSRETRNVLSFSIASGNSKTYNLTLTPTAATAYNGNVVITSNSTTQATYNLAVTGTGFTPPTIAVDAEQIAASLLVGEETTETFTISNTGSQSLNYSINLSEIRSRAKVTNSSARELSSGKNITGSTLV